MTDHFAEFSMPDTDLTRKAYDLAFSLGPPALARHTVRTYLFGRAIGEAKGVRPGADYDDETLFLASVLHDVGLTERGDLDGRFEVDGADVAAGFLREQGVDDERVRVVWEAIALHTSVGIVHRMRPEIALTHAGTGADIVALGAGALPRGFADRVFAAFPREDVGRALSEIIVDQIARNPAKAPMGSFPAELARQHGVGDPVPEWAELVAAAWPGSH
ncbi:HD domain-containing protein [Actinomadura sp. 9N215]|uniref:HD domain-containing protein n=1 Tax=Actinomadura sp. 9N215 TaxID=3375150 RepID=UPI00379E17C1